MKHLEGRTPGIVDPSPFTGAEVKPGAGAHGVLLPLEMEHAFSFSQIEKLMGSG
jgi:hypothetical protein